ncbi:hypothetical protein E2C01_040556 [Portunus trituberculatus]|uniref:U1-type domain-containing protein n=1 Tax=Portunus trituberculatus TaxID=210409 RepID=A0A5B7FMT9_PORTR|nr:hypothetical protein [Portunus trituberculatus]
MILLSRGGRLPICEGSQARQLIAPSSLGWHRQCEYLLVYEKDQQEGLLTQFPPDDSDDLWCKVCKTKVKNKKYNAEMHAKSQKHQRTADQIKGSPSV